MNVLIKNNSSQAIICKSDDSIIKISGFGQAYIDVSKSIEISHEKDSYIQKKWTGPIKHVNIKTQFWCESDKKSELEVFNKSIKNEDDWVFDFFYTNDEWKIEYKVQGKQNIISSLLRREVRHLLGNIFIFPLIYIAIDITFLDKIWLWIFSNLVDIRKYIYFFYLLIFIVNLSIQIIDYFGKEEKYKRQTNRKYLDEKYILEQITIYNPNDN